MYVCVCVNFYFVKDFSGTTKSRILKFCKSFGYDKLCCVEENQPPPDYHYLYLSIFLSLQSNFITYFLAPMRPRVFKFCIHSECGQVHCEKENQDAENYCCLLLPFFLFFNLSLPM